jgi:integrase
MGSETRICEPSQQLASGDISDEKRNASYSENLSVQRRTESSREDQRWRPISMGHYPWVPCQKAYLAAIKSYYGTKTLQTMERGLRTIYRAFRELHEAGKVTTTNPRKMTKEDIAAFMEWMGARKTRKGTSLAHSTQANYMVYLSGLLRFENNAVIDQMRELHYVRFPQKVSPEVRALPESLVEEIRSKLRTMPGYKGAVARFMVAIYAYAGLRRSELRVARLVDLDINSWTLVVAHPKGESSWAVAAPAPIMPPARETVVEFLRERDRYLAAEGIQSCEALVPKIALGKAGYWTDGMWGKVKAEAEKWCGISFHIQALRATFGQMCIDWGSRLDAVSRALRHKTTRTTELYYARIRPDRAFRYLEQAYDSAHPEKAPVPKIAD